MRRDEDALRSGDMTERIGDEDHACEALDLGAGHEPWRGKLDGGVRGVDAQPQVLHALQGHVDLDAG